MTFCKHPNPSRVLTEGRWVCASCHLPVKGGEDFREARTENRSTIPQRSRKAEMELIERKLRSAAALIEEAWSRLKELEAR